MTKPDLAGAPRNPQKFFGSFLQKRTDFFFVKKKQKTFVNLVRAVGLVCVVVGGQARAAPALWLVQGAHAKIYLFGTMHILPKPVPWFSGNVQAAFTESGTLWEEADVGLANPAAAGDMIRQGLDPSADLWSELPEASAETFRGELKKCKIDPVLVTNYKPWLAALMPTICDILAQSSGGGASAKPADASPEAILMKAARAGNKEVKFLETAADQIGYLANAPHAAQLEQLRKAIEEAATGKDDFAGLEQAWFNGDVSAIAKAVLQLRHDGEAFYQTILAQRNIRFAARIKQMLNQDGTVFIAIGAGHLAGPDCVQVALAKLGITTQLQ